MSDWDEVAAEGAARLKQLMNGGRLGLALGQLSTEELGRIEAVIRGLKFEREWELDTVTNPLRGE